MVSMHKFEGKALKQMAQKLLTCLGMESKLRAMIKKALVPKLA
jgi:hypothetical protein